jgi:hypothetical protein
LNLNVLSRDRIHAGLMSHLMSSPVCLLSFVSASAATTRRRARHAVIGVFLSVSRVEMAGD